MILCVPSSKQITLEPGYYKEGSFGIRIEDDLVVVKKSN
jgi:Xaa-Pro aminopeptidase